MKFQTFIPDKRLTDVVRYYWTLDGKLSPSEMYIHRTLANHCPEMIFHYGGEFKEILPDHKIEKTFRAGIHGQTDKIRKFTAIDHCGIFGVVLQPYASAFLFHLSAVELKNELIDLEDLLGQDGKDISEQILQASHTQKRIELMNAFLNKQLEAFKYSSIIQAIQSICSSKGTMHVSLLPGQSYLSQRQFERKFKDLVGFSPKSFSRVVRFKATVENYRAKNKTMTEMACDFGYYDQSHFIQDFKQFSGYSPKSYFGGKAHDIFYAPR